MSESVGAKALKVVSERSQRQLCLKEKAKQSEKAPPKVYDEEEFVERVEKIIERDFFPYYDEVKKQINYLEALDTQDSVRITEAAKALRQSSVRSTNTPAKDDWDDDDWVRNTPGPSSESKPLTKAEVLEKELKGVSLSKFLSKNTSEDNASFKEILKTAEADRRKKLDWVYKHENEDRALMPPPAAPTLAIGCSKQMENWAYKAHNTLMYIPGGVSQESYELSNGKIQAPEISHSATRLNTKPGFKKPDSTPQQANPTQGDGFWKGAKDQDWGVVSSSPKVNGFSFVATPSPRPGVGESPLMTWGEIESTPYRIDCMSESSSKFKMNPPSEREQLAIDLAEQNSAKKRKLKAHKSKQTSASNKNVPGSPSLSGLSPAAKRLAVAKLGISRGVDKTLMMSYTPDRGPKIGSTPSLASPFPSPSPRSTPSVIKPTKPKASDFF